MDFNHNFENCEIFYFWTSPPKWKISQMHFRPFWTNLVIKFDLNLTIAYSFLPACVCLILILWSKISGQDMVYTILGYKRLVYTRSVYPCHLSCTDLVQIPEVLRKLNYCKTWTTKINYLLCLFFHSFHKNSHSSWSSPFMPGNISTSLFHPKWFSSSSPSPKSLVKT